MNINVREVHKNDYDQIKDLHSKFNLNILNHDEWIKFWFKNPCFLESNETIPLGWVVEDNNKKIVGYLGNIFKEYYYKNKKIVISFMHAWVVENEYRLQAVLLMRKYFSQKNVEIFMNTSPNAATEKIWLKSNAREIPLKSFKNAMFVILDLEKFIHSFLKYKNIKVSQFIKKIIFYLLSIFFWRKLFFWKKINQTRKTNLNDNIDKKFDEFWFSYKKYFENVLLQSRTSDWINWHLQKKIEDGKAWIISVKDGDKLLGYVICLDTSSSKIALRRISLIDLVSLNDDKEVYVSLIKECFIEAKKRGYHTVELVGFKHLKKQIFSEFGVFKRKLPFSFLYKSTNQINSDFLEKNESWDSSLIDGEASF